MKENRGNALIWIVIIGAIAAFFIFRDGDEKSYNDSGYSSGRQSIISEKTLSRDEAIEGYWDEIKDYIDGTETIDACSSDSGNCYDLDADISNGQVEEIYFPNGGYLYFSADIDESGNASDFDQNGNGWDFAVDMDSSIIDDAVSDWASDNGYTLE